MKILIVDDAPYIVNMLKKLLESNGFETFIVTNGEEAIEKYKEFKPDIVLMDILMPKYNGLLATKKIIVSYPDAKIIAITAVSKDGLENDCFDAGVKAFIMKPFKITDLIQKIIKVYEQT